MMQPKRTQYRKQSKGDHAGLAQRGNYVAFGDFGLKATERARMTAREIEAARRAMARHVKRGGQIWIRVFPDVPITTKPLEVRMGTHATTSLFTNATNSLLTNATNSLLGLGKGT